MSGSPFGILEAYSANEAAETQGEAANRATQIQREMYYQGRADVAPWREAGANALTKLQGMVNAGPGEFKESPSYQFALSEGQQGIQRAASATGRLGSGAYLKDATKYAEGLASQEYTNFLNRYYQSLTPFQSLSGLGQTTAAQMANSSNALGNSIAQNELYAGSASAAGTIGSYGAIGKAMGEGARAVGSWGLNNIFGSGSGYGNGGYTNNYLGQL
jgi:hypothetical protein